MPHCHNHDEPVEMRELNSGQTATPPTRTFRCPECGDFVGEIPNPDNTASNPTIKIYIPRVVLDDSADRS